jgi:threonine dehydrogenase-like Zn-dependent dehydrogenase
MTFRPGDRVTFISYHAYAQFDVAPETSIVPLPSSLAGKAFPGEPIACAINIFARCDIRRGMTLAVVGIGFLGALLVMMAVNAGARVIAISRRAASLNVALRLGAEAAVPITGPDAIAERVSELTGGEYCDRTIESAGLQETLDIAAMCTRIRGRMIIAGYHQDGKRRVDMQLWNWRGIDCVNAHERDAKRYTQGLQTAVAAVASGVIDPFPLFTHRVPLEDADKAFGLLESRPDTFMKALLING